MIDLSAMKFPIFKCKVGKTRYLVHTKILKFKIFVKMIPALTSDLYILLFDLLKMLDSCFKSLEFVFAGAYAYIFISTLMRHSKHFFWTDKDR